MNFDSAPVIKTEKNNFEVRREEISDAVKKRLRSG